MNKTNIEWTDFTWNPVSGCKHKCRYEYCYNTQKHQSRLNRFGAKFKEENEIKIEKNWSARETGENHVAKAGEVTPLAMTLLFIHTVFWNLSERKQPV